MRLSDNYQHKSSIVTRGLTFFGSFVVAFVAAGLFSPLIVSNASDSSSSIAISIEPFIAVSQSSDTISLNTTPSATGTFSSGSNTYSISTNNSTGYTMSVTDLDTDTNLTNIANSEYNIPTLEETTGLSLDNFTINHWGLSSNYDSTNNTGTFYPIPASSGTAYVVSTDAPSEDNINLTLATKIDNTKSSGLYTDDIVVSVVTNTAPTYHKVFGGITTMQEMTPEICAAEPTPAADAETPSVTTYTNGYTSASVDAVPQAILTDTRDGKTYVVRKLANGTCWMSQNLDLDLVANEPIEAYDFSTNTTFSFIPENTTQTTTGTTWTKTGTEGARSYDNGNKYCIGDTGDQDCTATSSTDPTDHIGNYYNWYAATAGTGTSTSTSTVVQGSICPKGWRLPANTPSDTKSFANLFSSYGLPATNTNSLSDSNSNSPSIKVEKSPLSFIRSGSYYYSDGQWYSQGTGSYYWSSMSYSSATNAYYFAFGATHFHPQFNNNKGNGFSVRCVAV